MPSILTTDGYKFSMAQAGAPLRRETFYFSFRKGGWQYIPIDLEEEIRKMVPSAGLAEGTTPPKGVDLRDVEERAFLTAHGYALTDAMSRAFFLGELDIKAVPAGTWVHEREPIVTITGPSFLVSWLEPLVLRLFYPIQLATLTKKRAEEVPPWRFACTCEEQAATARRVLKAVNAPHWEKDVKVETESYRDWVRGRAEKLLAVVDAHRIFEVGMRAATCEEQHHIALEVLREAGIRTTSNVAAAFDLDMKPVGTMGHEHIQRWGDDLLAYRMMRDTRSGAPSYLLDTFDTITSGIPAAVRVMQEHAHECSIRYDSGDKFGQYVYAHGEFKRHGLEPTHVLEDGLTDADTAKFEMLRKHTGLNPDKQVYGYGGFLVDRGWNGIGRDVVAAVYKLTQTSGEPRMKFGNEDGLGKISVPGHPVTWRRLRGSGPLSIIGQDGEAVPDDYAVLNGNPEALDQLRTCNVDPPWRGAPEVPYTLSPETQRLVDSFGRSK